MIDRVQPVIKWTGAKSYLAPTLANLMPDYAGRAFDPFLGGGAMLPFYSGQVIASDIIPELVGFWTALQTDPQRVADIYCYHWQAIQNNTPDAYYDLRDAFNEQRDPLLLWCLTRFCFNGLIRFNRYDNFNVSFHHNRPGINPDTLAVIIDEWADYVRGVDFRCADYRDVLQGAEAGDFVFFDPPYMNTKGQYHLSAETFDYDALFAVLDDLNQRGVYWMMTLGGAGEAQIPAATDVIRGKEYSSSFKRIKQTARPRSRDVIYRNYEGTGHGAT